MASLKDLRNRISSVKSTQKITKAMQMVAAAKLRKAQEVAENARPYAERMEQVLSNLGQQYAGNENASPILVGTGKDDVHLLVVATADRGLCGGFNANIAKLARTEARNLLAKGKQVKILCVGVKGFDLLKSEFSHIIIDTITFRDVRKIGYENAHEVATRILDMLYDGEVDVVKLYFSEFKSVISQIPTELQMIPSNLGETSEEESAGSDDSAYDYEPDEEEILNDLLPRNIATQIFRGLLENAASEQGARMSAMDNATRNAGEMIEKLTLEYNRSRQAQITSELIEIISGAEAL